MIHHRIPTDCIAFASVATASFSSSLAFTEADWNRILGPLGGYALSVLMLAYFIVRDRNQNRDRKAAEKAAANERAAEAKARDDRHKETIGLQKENSAAILAITVRAVENEGKIAAALQQLTTELENRPCGMKP